MPEPARADGCALVTGASRGIGAAIARALAADGWAVGVNYRSDADGAAGGRRRDRGRRRPRGRAAGRRRRSGGARRAVRGARGGTSDVRCWRSSTTPASAATTSPRRSATRRGRPVIDTDLTAAFRLTRRALRPMMRARAGRIVNVASVVGLRANPGQANYAAAKAGLIALTRNAAVEVARRGITINAVAPGWIDTDDDRGRRPDAAGARFPARRAGTAEEVAACVRFLTSDAGRLCDRRGAIRRRRPGRMTAQLNSELTEGAQHVSDHRTGGDPRRRDACELRPRRRARSRASATFEELDIDSLDLVELAQVVEEEYGVVLKGEDMKDLKTVGDADRPDRRRGPAEWSRMPDKTQGRRHRARSGHAARDRRRAAARALGRRRGRDRRRRRAPAATSSPSDHLSVKEARRLDRFAQFAARRRRRGDGAGRLGRRRAARMTRCGSAASWPPGIGGHRHGRDPARRDARARAPGSVSPLGIPQYMPNAAAAAVTMKHGLRGQSYEVVSACASGAPRARARRCG